jgi:hypothetical protein
MARRARTSRIGGFTLVEAVSTMTVLAALGSLSSTIVFNAIDSYTSASTRSQIQAELSIVLDRLVRELRRIPSDSGGQDGPDIDAVTPTSLTWSANSSIAGSSGALTFIDQGQPALTLLDNAATIAIQCYDENNAAMATTLSSTACLNVRRIRIQLSLQRYGLTESLTTSVHLRNTMQGGSP